MWFLSLRFPSIQQSLNHTIQIHAADIEFDQSASSNILLSMSIGLVNKPWYEVASVRKRENISIVSASKKQMKVR